MVELAVEIVTDLLRSCWVIEAARAEVYRTWCGYDGAFEPSQARAAERADLVAAALDEHARKPDLDLVDPHASWMRSLVGERPGEIALGDLLLVRLGDWVDGHAAPFVPARDELRRLGEQERSAVRFPARLPSPPPFEPVTPVEIEPPGEVKLRFAVLGDLHVGSKFGARAARAAIRDINASGAELVVQLGDITEHGNRDEFERAAQILEELQAPVVTMIGNHDVFSLKEERLSGREYYPMAFGREADGVLLEHKGVRFAVLDSAEIAASPFAPFDMVSGSFGQGPAGAIVRGSFTPPQHDILADVAAAGAAPAFVFLHHPPQPFTGFPPVIFGLRDTDTGRLHATCDSGNVWGVFAGHTHRNALTRRFDSVPSIEVAIPRDYPFGYALVDVTEHGYAYRFQQISDEGLLRELYASAGEIQRRYALGPPEVRGFAWQR